ncbi:nucleoside triphosphate pyrophosphohydrolase ham1 [Aspergillus brasiliensis]|nr:nucleoside triphosphate pyrophosphohydrolase ham1 [Aspergillus brasiliensis]
MALLNKLNFITGNKNKLAEVKAILGTVIDVENQAVDLPEIQGTIEDIAREKCRRAAEVVGGPVLTEDTALEFHALKGLPGPYICLGP